MHDDGIPVILRTDSSVHLNCLLDSYLIPPQRESSCINRPMSLE